MRKGKDNYCKLTDAGAEYLCDIFSSAAPGTVQNMNLREGKFFASSAVTSETTPTRFKQICGAVYKDDAFFTPNTYVPGHRTKKVRSREINVYSNVKESAMFSCNVWGLDIDYKARFERNGLPIPNITPIEYYEYLMSEVGDMIPVPTYIETGHQLRLVYVLAEPIKMKTANAGAARALYRGLKAVMAHLCEVINNTLDCGAEPQKAWYRIPGSVNTKNGGAAVVEVVKVEDAPRYTVQELLSEYLPDLPMSSKEYKKYRKNKKKGRRSAASLQRMRIEDYKKLTAVPGIPRELLVFLYGAAYKELYGPDRLMDALIEFNGSLYEPLRDKEVRSKFGHLGEKFYKFTNDTIMAYLGLSESDCQELGLHLGKSKKKDSLGRQAARKAARAELEAARDSKIEELYSLGYSAASIAELVDISESCARRRITSIRSRMDDSARACLRKKQRETSRWNEFAGTRAFNRPAPCSSMRRAVLMARGKDSLSLDTVAETPCSQPDTHGFVSESRIFGRGSP